MNYKVITATLATLQAELDKAARERWAVKCMTQVGKVYTVLLEKSFLYDWVESQSKAVEYAEPTVAGA